MTTVTVVVPIHHGGRHRRPGDRLDVSEDAAAVLVAAGLVTVDAAPAAKQVKAAEVEDKAVKPKRVRRR